MESNSGYGAIRTQREVASIMGVSQWTVAEVEKSALRKLQHALSNYAEQGEVQGEIRNGNQLRLFS